ncbi:hypothetical protein [Paraburkholderia sediminicola]|uniref:hypothetical protein n=1 Tax=Paraburkholderia sediminicola TaxID=458836 RepID=UPI0038B75CDF
MKVKANSRDYLPPANIWHVTVRPPQCDVQHDKGHGRVGTRTVHAYDLPPDRLPEGRQPLVPQVARGSRTVGRRKAGGWHMTNETAWWIGTAVPEAPAFQCAIRG